MRVGIYTRLSDDRDGTQTATARQREDCERYAASRGWEVVDVFEDVDLSAWSRRVKRPEFERLLKAVADRELDVVLAWKFDRVLRSIRDFARIKDAAEDGGAYLVDMFGIDTSTASGKMQAGMMAIFAEAESDNISARVARKHLERAQNGLPKIGGYRTFGYSPDRSVIVHDEAALICEARDRVFGGETIHGICEDWRKRGIKTSAGKDWRQTTLSRLLCSSTIAGQREHRGIITDGTWDGIVSPEDVVRLRAILKDPSRRTNASARKYLLTGLLFCGLCDEPLVGRPNGKRKRYVCNRSPGSRGCGKITRLAAPLEEYVVEMVLNVLRNSDLSEFTEDEPEVDELTWSIRQDEEALAELSRHYYVERRLSRAEFFQTRDTLEARINETRRRLSRRSGKPILAEVISAGSELDKVWDEKPDAWKRAVIAATTNRITILPADRGVRFFDSSKVEIDWRT